MGRNDLEKSEATNRLIRKNSNSNSLRFLEKGNEHPAWLPDGWNVDFRIRKSGAHMGAGYKCYIDPLNGYKFYSKPEVLRYLETVQGSNCTLKKEKGCTAEHSPSKLSSSAKRQKLKHSAINQRLFAGKEASGKDILELSDANSSKNGQDVKASAEFMVASVSTYDSVVKMHSLGDAAENHAEIKESNPADVQEKNYIMSVMEKANEENHCSTSTSKKKKELNVPNRCSRRLARIGPDQLTNTVTHEQAPQVSKRNLRKSITTIDVDLENKSCQQLNVVPEIERVHKMHGELLNKNNNSSEIEPIFRDQPCQLVPGKIDNEKPEHQYSRCQDSSAPSLKVEMKTITDEFPAMDYPHTDQCLASEANVIKENKLHVNQIGKNDASEIHVNLNKSGNRKEHCNPCRRASKRLAGLEPEVMTNSLVCKRAPEYKNRRPKGKVNAVLQQSEGGPAVELAGNASTYINAPLNGESSNKSRISPKIPPITHEQPEKHGNEEMDDEKSEPQLSIAFHYSWSDPCLEFAIKTLTGVLPIGDSVGNGPNFATETELFEKNKLFDRAEESSSNRNLQVNFKKLKNKKELRLPRRLSKRLAGHEPEAVPALRALEYATRKSCKDKSTATVVSTNGASKLLGAGKETELTLDASDSLKSGVLEEPSNRSEKSYGAQNVPNDQWHKLETDKIGDKSSETQLCLVIGKETEHTLHASDNLATRVLEEVSNKSEKSCEAQTVEELNKSVKLYEAHTIPMEQKQKLETEVSSETQLCLPVGKETNCTLHASGSLETRVLEDTSNKSEKSYEAQTIEELLYEDRTVPNEQQHKLEAEILGDVRSESQLYLTFGDSVSDPCLEFAINTLTDALPVDAAADILPAMSPDTNDQADKELLDSVVKSVKEESHDNRNESQNNKVMTTNLFFQPSKQLLEQTQSRTSSTFRENTVSHSDEVDLTRNLDEGESLNMEAVKITKPVHHGRNGDTLIHEVEAIPSEQPQLETQIISHEKPEAQFCYQFMDSWSDPCLEFAFKTLTGAITVEENLPIQGCLEGQRDGGSTLPDFGSTSFSLSDISSYYNIGEKSKPGQQS